MNDFYAERFRNLTIQNDVERFDFEHVEHSILNI